MYKFGYIRWFQTGAWFHPLVPWSTLKQKVLLVPLKQKPLAVASFLRFFEPYPVAWNVILFFYNGYHSVIYVEDLWPFCSHQVFAAGSLLGPCATSTHGLFQDSTCSERMKLFCSSDVECLPTGLISISTISLHMVYWHIFVAWAQDISMYCSPPFNTDDTDGSLVIPRSIPELLYLLATDTSAHSRSWAMKEFQVWVMGMEQV